MVDANPGGGFVDQVDGLVRQESVGDIAGRKVRGGSERLVIDLKLVVFFVAALDAPKNLDGLVNGRLFDPHGLEPAFQSWVAFDVFAIVVQGRRSDGLKLASGEGWFEYVGSVNRAFCGACADHRVNLVNEQHAVAGVSNLFDDLF